MERIAVMAAVFALLASVVSPAAAGPVPERATGIWSVGKCGGAALTLLVGSNDALIFEPRGNRIDMAMARAEWFEGAILVTVYGEREETILPPLDDMKRCKAPPIRFSLMFAESAAVFRRLSEIEKRCADGKGGGSRCAGYVFDLFDISDDGKFSKAEISRAIRAASLFVGYRMAVSETGKASVPLEQLSIAWVAASLLGPTVAANLIDSYDFDGDGFLSPKELLQDRPPAAGIEGVAAGLAANLPPKMISGLMKSMSGLFFGLLK